jgi:hypothetical protein
MLRKSRIVTAVVLAGVLRRRALMSFEIVLGRTLALCLNPGAAWRVLGRPGRALVVGAYACAGFVATLAVLVLL